MAGTIQESLARVQTLKNNIISVLKNKWGLTINNPKLQDCLTYLSNLTYHNNTTTQKINYSTSKTTNKLTISKGIHSGNEKVAINDTVFDIVFDGNEAKVSDINSGYKVAQKNSSNFITGTADICCGNEYIYSADVEFIEWMKKNIESTTSRKNVYEMKSLMDFDTFHDIYNYEIGDCFGYVLCNMDNGNKRTDNEDMVIRKIYLLEKSINSENVRPFDFKFGIKTRNNYNDIRDLDIFNGAYRGDIISFESNSNIIYIYITPTAIDIFDKNMKIYNGEYFENGYFYG